ncbi:peptidoglycan-binding protein [Clostridioides sp. ES-S-0108-01]|uniref:peptidoglycan-binding domain-containing protein n=1 Tax=unclassified Clostridioides TaxID=2635829 RepID=UPI001D0C7F18|nr:peptidoglycan-binding domain-containing protein [Clostridioides sp. ES-S-0107-01]MCC0785147.1 peptidoglycan-binding protein [Clostridioides sp. ES-S-0108-01]UDN53025.1 peptidoglycan-binding protein [Clostridioides sp. ES-S-0107-01]
MLKKFRKILIVSLCFMLLSSSFVLADSTDKDTSSNKATKEPIFSFSIDGYTFKYKDAPQILKDEYDKNCKEIGIIPSADSEIFIPMDEMDKYKQNYTIDDSISTYSDFTISYYETYFHVSGDKTYNVYVTTYVGYGHVTSGNPVHLVQLLLKKVGFYTGIDSIFGNDTYKKVKSFQSKYGLQADGVVGLGTWKTFADVANL